MTFRKFQGEADFELMRLILMASTKADQMNETATVDDIRNLCAPTKSFDPQNDILFALDKRNENEYTEVGFSRVSWYSGKEDAQLYSQISYLVPEYRQQGVWPEIVRENECRLREISASHPNSPKRFFQAWATETQEEWISTLEKEEYKAVRHFNNMLRPLESIPEQEFPIGLEVRPVQPEHYRSIWEAQKEVHRELFETVSENWKDGNYKPWLKNPSHTPHLWQVAWDGNQVAGMALARINEVENRKLDRKRGYTEHIFVRKPWRRCGLAKALIIRSLRALKMEGMEEAELGVDSENESGAYEFYKRMGYQTFSTDLWFRKPMEEKSDST